MKTDKPTCTQIPIITKIFKKLHKKIEDTDGGNDITNEVMAKKLGCSHDTYRRYRTGLTEPVGAEHLLMLLARLADKDVLDLVNHYRELKNIQKSL